MAKKTNTPGVGLDIGTMNFVSCRIEPGTESDRSYRQVTDAYIELDVENVKTLKMSQIPYVDFEDVLVVTGEKSFQMANLFKQEVQRPLSKGLVAPGALRAQKVLMNLVFSVLEEPYETNEHCYYSVPADPLDIPDQNVIFHRDLFKKIIEDHGYTAHSVNEAMAIIYSECESSMYSGLALSFGAGLCNVALSYNAFMGLNFSISSGGGDWIDANAARSTGSTAARMCTLKERGGFNLKDTKHKSPEVEAIVVYTRALIKNCLERISEKMRKDKTDHSLSEPIPLVVSGGTTLMDGFMDVFQDVLREVQRTKGFPLNVSEVRRAKDPLKSVAEGLMKLARTEYL